jgi:hypothetical protein
VKDRLAAATWPLHDASGKLVDGTGVIDLVKVAAVRHHALEVVEQGENGDLVRRTYVGMFEVPHR